MIFGKVFGFLKKILLIILSFFRNILDKVFGNFLRATHLGQGLKKCGTIIKKDYKLLLRAKSSAVIAVLGPLILVFLVGMGFNTSSLTGLQLGVYSDSYSDFSNSLIDILDDRFSVIKAENEEECINGVRVGEHHVCAIFPSDLNVNSQEEINFYVDYSRINLVYSVIDILSGEIGKKTEELSLQYSQALIERINLVEEELGGKESVLSSLTSNSGQIESKVLTISENLNNLNLNFTGKNTTDLKDAVSDAEAEHNISLSSIKTEVNHLEDFIDDLIEKASAARSSREAILTDIDIIQKMVTQNSDNLKTLDSSIANILSSVRSLEIKSAETVATPIKTSVKPVTSEKTNLNYLFPIMIVLVVMFISILLASSVTIREKTSNAYFRNFITPTNEFTHLFGSFLTNLSLVLIELVIIFGIAMIFFKAELLSVLGNAAIVLFLMAMMFILLGMLVGYIFKSTETSNLASISLVSILLFFSNTILPLENLPLSIKNIVMLNPFVVSEALLKRVMLFGSSLNTEIYYILIIVIYIIIFGVFAFIAREATKRRLG
jgi:ABC-type multidrug transport system permease subunit